MERGYTGCVLNHEAAMKKSTRSQHGQCAGKKCKVSNLPVSDRVHGNQSPMTIQRNLTDDNEQTDSWQAILERLQVLHDKHDALLREENEVCRKVFERMTVLVKSSVHRRKKAPAWVAKLVISMQRGMEPKVVAPEKFLEPLSKDPFHEIKEWRENGKHFGYWYVQAKCALQQEWPVGEASSPLRDAMYTLYLAEARSHLELAMATGDLRQASEFLTGYADAVRTAFTEDEKPILGRDSLSYPIRYLMVSHWPEVERFQCLDELCAFLLKKLPENTKTRVGFREMVRGVCRACGKTFPRTRGRPPKQ